jgi:hypothetical protein
MFGEQCRQEPVIDCKVDLTKISLSIDPPEAVAHSLMGNDSLYGALCAEE